MKSRMCIYTVLLIVFFIMSVTFGFFAVTEKLPFIIPCIIGGIGTICAFVIILFYIFSGHKSFYVEGDKLHITHKKAVVDIEKRDIRDLLLVFDAVYENLYMIVFKHNNKRYFITEKDIAEVNSFFENMEHRKTTNTLYYLIEFLVL